MKKKINKIYVAGALTYANDKLKETYLKIAEICKIICDDIYVPHAQGTDPINHPYITPAEVWRRDERAVSSSNLIIAYVGEPSLGTGGELEIARYNKIDIILWWFKGQKVSRLPRGNPAVIAQIEADNENELYEKLNFILKDKYELKK
ncbi:MAG: XRE family transcriptional regulator [Candidatus Falkowbacteria bacterium]